ncbi:DMT family transporter [Mesorhizobium sp. M4B.F.Ca.ET.215.01.1.1]|uniref:DMT family transporter n=1 Tax=unclassified Mesorhizobium TaxID=325217 RepID=UPI000FCB71D2|nr:MULTISPECIES: DMT family transporter [unclassified Mesorhizobium]RUW22323.1 DMT family transporter [Mesorhizobium sp. M4B.F.Ca.ET.013.02.1.1]RVD43317.1 DMT family transporter [Mesorhizobium sp. M4B.F.Ca.ET.019.03.1.1]RWF66483.1 MAG: DMT family transporter [Mesorhizobium sp.]TGQ08385.1 DMT family transporter [Mesorhizobium sp. M4B.F.Ca.ET.215.01.1.1]TGQ33789.1 DMT family transporter [Mesorhizobium sp. M4B.F.Ca.ET.214.01.1.1]
MAPAPSIPKAAFWMALSIASFLAMSVAGRATTAELNVFQVLELRSVIGFLILLPLVMMSGGFAAMRTERPLAHLARNIVHYSGQAAWLYALTLIPLAVLISIEFTTPIWTAILAVSFLGEKLSRPRLAAIVLGLIGVVIIVRPGLGTMNLGELIVLGAAVCFGTSVVLVKSLTRTDSVVSIIFWMLIIQSVLGLAPALYEWRNPPLELWPWIVVIAFTGMSSHFCMARALTHADATLISPMDFLRVPLSALIGWLLYHEQIDVFTAGGALLILTGNLLNLKRHRSRPRSPLHSGAARHLRDIRPASPR